MPPVVLDPAAAPSAAHGSVGRLRVRAYVAPGGGLATREDIVEKAANKDAAAKVAAAVIDGESGEPAKKRRAIQHNKKRNKGKHTRTLTRRRIFKVNSDEDAIQHLVELSQDQAGALRPVPITAEPRANTHRRGRHHLP